MKKLNILLLGILVLFAACEDPYYNVEGEGESLATSNFVADQSSAKEIVLNQLEPRTKQYFQWGEAEAGLGSEVNYVFMLDKDGTDFSDPIIVDSVGSLTEFSLSHQQLRAQLAEAGLDVIEGAKIAWRVAAFVETNMVESPVFVASVKLDMFDVFLTGGFTYPTWNNGQFAQLAPDAENPIMKSIVVHAPENVEFKFTNSASWDNAIFGFSTDDEGNQIIVNDGGSANLYFGGGESASNAAGYYKITFDSDTKTFTTEAVDASAANAPATMHAIVNGEAVTMTQDENDPNVWKASAIRLAPGDMVKFAEASDAATFYGINPDLPNGVLINDANAQEISLDVAASSVYDLTFNSLVGYFTVEGAGFDVSKVINEMYLVGAGSMAGWSPEYGVPMVQNEAYPVEWSATTYIYNPADEGVKFVGQRTGWDPVNIGNNGDTPDVDDDLLNAGHSGDIKVDGAAGYYKFTINTETMKFRIESVTPDVDVINEMYAVGAGIGTAPDWDPANATAMTQDTNNPYRYSLEVTLKANASIKFVGQKDWSPNNFGLVDKTDIFSGIVNDGGSQDIPVGNAAEGNYRITFDYFAGQFVIQPL